MSALREFKVAVLLGVLLELVLGVYAFMAKGELTWTSPWVQISQMPGGDIAVRLFRFTKSGMLPALACVIIIQSAIYVSLIFTVLYVFRLLRSGLPSRQR
jgi:hypothetical protein